MIDASTDGGICVRNLLTFTGSAVSIRSDPDDHEVGIILHSSGEFLSDLPCELLRSVGAYSVGHWFCSCMHQLFILLHVAISWRGSI